MMLPIYDQFLADVLRKEKMAFGFVTHPAYQADFPGERVWLLICALVREKELTLNQAARIVLDFTEREGAQIPRLLTGSHLTGKTSADDAAETRQQTYQH